METEGLLRHLRVQEPATYPCPEPSQSSPCLLSFVLKIHFNITLPSMPVSSKWCLSLRLSLQYPVCTSLASPISFCLSLLQTRYMIRPSHSHTASPTCNEHFHFVSSSHLKLHHIVGRQRFAINSGHFFQNLLGFFESSVS
jgi:hypothetical protein